MIRLKCLVNTKTKDDQFEIIISFQELGLLISGIILLKNEFGLQKRLFLVWIVADYEKWILFDSRQCSRLWLDKAEYRKRFTKTRKYGLGVVDSVST